MIRGGGLEGLVQHLKTLAAIRALCIIDGSVCMRRPSVGGVTSLLSERVNKLHLRPSTHGPRAFKTPSEGFPSRFWRDFLATLPICTFIPAKGLNPRNIPTVFPIPTGSVTSHLRVSCFSPSFQTCRGNGRGPTIAFSLLGVFLWRCYHSLYFFSRLRRCPPPPHAVPSLWGSVTDVCMGRVQMWEPSLESGCSIRRLHYTPGILESLSPPVVPSSSASVFLPLTVAQQGASSHSAQRGLEELKATEQKKNRKRERRRGVEGGGGGKGRAEVLRPERSGRGARGLGGEDGQISMEMKTGIGGMTARTGGIYGTESEALVEKAN